MPLLQYRGARAVKLSVTKKNIAPKGDALIHEQLGGPNLCFSEGLRVTRVGGCLKLWGALELPSQQKLHLLQYSPILTNLRGALVFWRPAGRAIPHCPAPALGVCRLQSEVGFREAVKKGAQLFSRRISVKCQLPQGARLPHPKWPKTQRA